MINSVLEATVLKEVWPCYNTKNAFSNNCKNIPKAGSIATD